MGFRCGEQRQSENAGLIQQCMVGKKAAQSVEFSKENVALLWEGAVDMLVEKWMAKIGCLRANGWLVEIAKMASDKFRKLMARWLRTCFFHLGVWG